VQHIQFIPQSLVFMIMKQTFMRLSFALYFLLVFSRCGKDIPPPSYLVIDEFTLQANVDVDYGQLTHAFRDVYVYIDNQNYGVFPVPCTIPINLNGIHEIRLMPAVRKDGQSGAKTRYPFVEHHIQSVNFMPLDSIFIQPITKYYSTTQVWYEDFEDAAVQIESSALSMMDMVKSNNPEILTDRNGNFFGFIMLDVTNNIWDATTNANWTINPGQNAYLEIDFYNTNPIQTGVRAQGPLGLNNWLHVLIVHQEPQEIEWKKMYIDLRPFVIAAGNGNIFKLIMSSILLENETTSMVAIDNIKLVYR